MQTQYFSFQGVFSDVRLDRAGNSILNSMIRCTSAVLHRCTTIHSCLIRFYRFVNNESIDMEDIEAAYYEFTSKQVVDREVVIIQDTTEFNFEAFRELYNGSDPDLGPLTNNHDIGFYNHLSLVIDARSSFPIGFSDIQLFNRTFDQPTRHERKYKSLPIEEKESYRWIKSIEQSKEVCRNAARRWFVSDRESDIYELYDRVIGDNDHVVIRVCKDRLIAGGDQKLYEFIAGHKSGGSFKLEFFDHKSQERSTSKIDVRFGKVRILKPEKKYQNVRSEFVDLSFVEARSEGNDRICWRLLTDVEVNSMESAQLILDRYKQRWHIEVFFGLLKSKGLNVELSQMASGKGLKIVCLLAMKAALRINQLRLAFKNPDLETTADPVFSTEELIVLSKISSRFEGKTEKQKNPFKNKSLAWASWIIARMGNWKGYFSQDPPGITSFTEGYFKFQGIMEFAELMK